MRSSIKTEIMVTAGPTIEEVNQIKKAIQAGGSSFRINCGLKSRMFEHFAVHDVVNRAELSDTALAVRQQADLVMLSRDRE